MSELMLRSLAPKSLRAQKLDLNPGSEIRHGTFLLIRALLAFRLCALAGNCHCHCSGHLRPNQDEYLRARAPHPPRSSSSQQTFGPSAREVSAIMFSVIYSVRG